MHMHCTNPLAYEKYLHTQIVSPKVLAPQSTACRSSSRSQNESKLTISKQNYLRDFKFMELRKKAHKIDLNGAKSKQIVNFLYNVHCTPVL